ncbi:MAG: hypothetical protein ACJ8IK_02840 [Burkholderiaceae bacterium]
MRASTSRAVMALTLAAGLAATLPAVAADAAAAASSAASQPENYVRPAFAASFNAAQDALKNGNGTAALAKLKEVETIPDLSPYEKYLLLRLRGPAEYSINDTAAAAADYDAILANRMLPAEDRPAMLKALASIYYGSEQYPKAAVALQRYFDAGGNDAQLKELLPQAQYAAKDYANAAKGFRAEVDAAYAAGHVPSEKLLRLEYSAYVGLKDEAGIVSAMEHLAVNYSKPDYWRDLIPRVREVDNFSERLVLDYYRLKTQVFGQVDDRERLNYAAIAARAGYPGEAKKVLDAAAAGKPFAGNDLADANRLRPEVTRAAAADAAQQAANETAARNAKDGNALVTQGLLEAATDNPAKGATLIEQGIAKGGLKQPEDAKLHLGYAQVRAGRDADAMKTFQSVKGPNGLTELAHLWVLYLQSRQAPAAAPAAAASR